MKVISHTSQMQIGEYYFSPRCVWRVLDKRDSGIALKWKYLVENYVSTSTTLEQKISANIRPLSPLDKILFGPQIRSLA